MLQIHQPYDPIKHKNLRMHVVFFNTLIEELQKKSKIEVYRYNDQANNPQVLIENQRGETFKIRNCEMALCRDDGKVLIISYSNSIDGGVVATKHLKNFSIYFAHFEKYMISRNLHNTPASSMKNFKPFFFNTFRPIDLNVFYRERKNSRNFIDKMVFIGDHRDCIRPVLKKYNDNLVYGYGVHIADHSKYLKEIIKYKVGLSIGGVGEYCYRDFEYLALGIPMIRAEYKTTSLVPLVPNFHYIAVERENSYFPHEARDPRWSDRDATVDYVRAVEKKFLEVKDDEEFLRFISRNGREYYNKYIKPERLIENTMRIIELEIGI